MFSILRHSRFLATFSSQEGCNGKEHKQSHPRWVGGSGVFRDKTLENNLSRRLDGDHMLAGANSFSTKL